MEQRYNLSDLPVMDSMHDQRIESMELKEKKFVLHYENLFNKGYHTCDVIFYGVEEADILAEVRETRGLHVEGDKYYDAEFLEYITYNQYYVETITYYQAYGMVVIHAALVNLNGEYCKECIIRVSAVEVLYCWY